VKVVLLHALPLDERMWEPQLEALSGYEVTTPRLYDLGETMDEWAGAVLRQVGGPFAAIGASMGGYCALAIARRAPERVLALGLVGSRPEADPPERRPLRDRWLRRIAEQGAAGLWEEMGPSVFATLDAEQRARVERLALEQTPEGLRRAVTAIRDRLGASDVVRELSGPLLVAVGENDPLVSVDDARVVADAASRSRLAVFEGAGHLPSLECPEDFNECLLAFLESVD